MFHALMTKFIMMQRLITSEITNRMASMQKETWRLTCLANVLIAMMGFTGCKPATHVAESKPATPPVLSESAVATLAWADAHDGNVDHIIGECATCRLHMNGKDTIVAALDEYTLYLCSERCRVAVEEDPEAVLSQIKRE